MSSGLFVGSLDPIHNGHLALIKTATEECDILFVVVSSSSDKKHLFSLDTRAAQVNAAIRKAGIASGKVIVSTSSAHISDICLRFRPSILFRGVRSKEDRENEQEYYKMATAGLAIKPELFLIEAEKGLENVSSSRLKSLLSYGHGILNLVPHPGIVHDMYHAMFNIKISTTTDLITDKMMKNSHHNGDIYYITDSKICEKIATSKLPGVVQDREAAIDIFKSVTGEYTCLMDILNYSVDNEDIEKARALISRQVRAEIHSGIRFAIERRKTSIVIAIGSAEKCGLNNFCL